MRLLFANTKQQYFERPLGIEITFCAQVFPFRFECTEPHFSNFYQQIWTVSKTKIKLHMLSYQMIVWHIISRHWLLSYYKIKLFIHTKRRCCSVRFVISMKKKKRNGAKEREWKYKEILNKFKSQIGSTNAQRDTMLISIRSRSLRHAFKAVVIFNLTSIW